MARLKFSPLPDCFAIEPLRPRGFLDAAPAPTPSSPPSGFFVKGPGASVQVVKTRLVNDDWFTIIVVG